MDTGDVVNFPTFLSTSWDPQVAMSFYARGAESSGGTCCFVRFAIPAYFPALYANVGSYAWEREVVLPFMYLEEGKPWHKQPLKWVVSSKKSITMKYPSQADSMFSDMKTITTTLYTLKPQNYTEHRIPRGLMKRKFRIISELPLPSNDTEMTRQEAEEALELPLY